MQRQTIYLWHHIVGSNLFCSTDCEYPSIRASKKSFCKPALTVRPMWELASLDSTISMFTRPPDFMYYPVSLASNLIWKEPKSINYFGFPISIVSRWVECFDGTIGHQRRSKSANQVWIMFRCSDAHRKILDLFCSGIVISYLLLCSISTRRVYTGCNDQK